MVLDEGTREVLVAHARGDLSSSMAAARLLVLTRDVQGLCEALRHPGHGVDDCADDDTDDGGASWGSTARDILETLEHHRAAATSMLELLDREAATDADAPDSIDERLQRCRELFDWAVARSPESSVAAYSFGSQQLLDVATAELIDLMRRLEIVRPGLRLLDIGCGTGRLETALAPTLGAITGIDLSPAMIAHARQRCAAYGNVRFEVSDGRDLRPWADAAFDSVVMVDAFPYVYRAGGVALAERQLGEMMRVVRPGGQVGIFNLSYRGDPDRDRAEARAFAAALGLELRRNGSADLRSWDGLTFHFTRPR